MEGEDECCGRGGREGGFEFGFAGNFAQVRHVEEEGVQAGNIVVALSTDMIVYLF